MVYDCSSDRKSESSCSGRSGRPRKTGGGELRWTTNFLHGKIILGAGPWNSAGMSGTWSISPSTAFPRTRRKRWWKTARPPYPEAREDEKWRAVGRGYGGRWIQVIYVSRSRGQCVCNPCPTAYISREKARTKEERMKKNAAAGAGRKRGKRVPAAKPYWDMTTAELREATAEFEGEFIGDTFGPPTPEQRAQDRRARRKRGRPRTGLGPNHFGHGREAVAGPDRSPRQEVARGACRLGRPRAPGCGQ